MKNFIYILLLLISINIYAVAPCDNNGNAQACIGNAITIKVNKGLGAQYVDVKKSTLNSITDKMTFEAWLKPDLERGFKQFVAGIWGPGQDKNDVWAIYIDATDSICFEINGTNTNLGQTDNTIAKAFVGNLNQTWFHLAVTFDGATQEASILINGAEISKARNANYPVSRLRDLENKNLSLQIASTNALSNSTNNRTFRGQIDEVRLWNKVLNFIEINCQKDISLNDSYSGLQLYYRCNEARTVFQLCDASNKGNFGDLRSGAVCEPSNRAEYKPFIVEMPVFPDTIRCATRKVYEIKVTDTSLCGSMARIRILDRPQYFQFNQTFVQLSPNRTTSFTFSYNSNYVGKVSPRIYIERQNRCGQAIVLQRVDFVRETDLKASVDSIDLGIAKKNCVQEPYREKTIKICNNTSLAKGGSNKVITINGLSFKKNIFQIVSPTNFPINLQPDGCIDITVRLFPNDTNGFHFDTLRINSTDLCSGNGSIPVRGKIEEILKVLDFNRRTNLDSIRFGEVCINYFSNPFLFQYINLSSTAITLDSMRVPKNFEASNLNFPLTLEPNIFNQQKYIRFAPLQAGTYNDSIIFYGKAGGCVIRKVVYVSGKCIDTKLDFTVTDVDFGTVIVGQDRQVNVSVKNLGNEAINVQFYLRRGDAFFFPTGRSVGVQPGQTQSIAVQFRPISDSLYLDEICYFETRCFESKCIPIKGRGVNERFLFNPNEMRTTNVIACGSQLDTIEIINNTTTTEVLNRFVLNDPSTKFSIVEPPSLSGFTSTLKSGEKQRFIFRYSPNDVTQDRADRAFLDYYTSDNVKWSAKLYGTSSLPKLFISDKTTYGTIEVGEKRRRKILIENISSLDITLDSVNIDSAFYIIYPLDFKNRTLKPRDTIEVTVEFYPQKLMDYLGYIRAFASKPCTISSKGELTGKSKIVPIEMNTTLITYGFIRPCECEERKIPLQNNSLVNATTIDSIWIDGVGVSDPYPQFFSWLTKSNVGKLPFDIPSSTIDTLSIFYCPKSLAIRDSIVHSAKIHIRSRGPGWTAAFDRFISGKQMLFMEPSPDSVAFPPTRVDNFAQPKYAKITIPDIDVNPARSGVTIDSITFEPADNVFFASDSLKKSFPITITGNDTFKIKVDFKPRAPKQYSAKMKIHFSSPCIFQDTTILVMGSGFAPAFGMGFAFQDPVQKIDSISIISCERLFLPVFANRKIPAGTVDIRCRIGYDTTLFDYIGYTSPYFSSNCFNRSPKLTNSFAKEPGMDFFIENLCDVDSLRPFLIAEFKPRTRATVQDTFKIDSIQFDTKEVILYQIITTTDKILVKTKKSDFRILSDVDFNSVRVLDCTERDLVIQNTGEVNLEVNNLLNLPSGVTLVNVNPPVASVLIPNQTATFTLRYCPRKKDTLNQKQDYSIIVPCDMIDSNMIFGSSYAPPYPVATDISINYNSVDTVNSTIGDTVTIPIYFEKDLSANYQGIQYWIEDLSFNLRLEYRREAMKLIRTENLIPNTQPEIQITDDFLQFNFKGIDSLKAGMIAKATFVIVVPDSSLNLMRTSISNFETTNILFLDLQNTPLESYLNVGGQCNINTVIYGGEKYNFQLIIPNPTNGQVKLNYTLGEKTNYKFEIYNVTGQLVKTLYETNAEMPFGSYSLTTHISDLEAGNYFVKFSTPNYQQIQNLIINK